MLPTNRTPYPASAHQDPRSRRLLRQGAAVLATILLVVAFAATFQFVRGAPTVSRSDFASSSTLPTAPGATAATAHAGPATTGTPTPPRAPTATTATSGTLKGDVRVTQNQDMRPACLDSTAAYTVVLFNAGTVSANWHVYIPAVVTLAPIGPTAATQPLFSPLSSSPFWAQVIPQDGSVAPGQSASFVMSPVWAMPCGGTTYHASVQLSFPSGASQPDIPLTYAGTGPAPYSNVVLVSGSPTNTQSCPAGGVAPPPFSFALKNTGNATAYPSIDNTKDSIGINPWADVSSVTYDPPNPPVTTWLYAGETWTVTIAPRAIVACGTTYHIYVYINNAQGTSQTMTFAETFQ